MLGVSTFQRKMSRTRVFSLALVGAGVALFLAASMSTLVLAMLCVGAMGICAGVVYVMGWTILQDTVEDELRGRTFAALYTVIRLCLLISLTISPLWADMWDAVSSVIFTDRAIEIGGATYALPGVRIALWGGGLIAFFAGFVSWRAVQRARKRERERVASGVAPEPGA